MRIVDGLSEETSLGKKSCDWILQKSIARARSCPEEPSMSRPEEAQSHDYGQESSGAAVTDVIC